MDFPTPRPAPARPDAQDNLPEESHVFDFDAELGLLGQIAQTHGLASRWSAAPKASELGQRAFSGTFRLRYRQHWGDREAVGAPICDPTWLDLWRAADLAIAMSGDFHHIFVESFVVDGPFIELHTGS